MRDVAWQQWQGSLSEIVSIGQNNTVNFLGLGRSWRPARSMLQIKEIPNRPPYPTLPIKLITFATASPTTHTQ